MAFIDKLFSTKPTRDQFAQIVLRDLANKGVRTTRYDQARFAIRVGADTLFLDNSYANYCEGDKLHRAETLAHLTAGFAANPEIPKDYATVLPNLMPIVRRQFAYPSRGSYLPSIKRSHQ